MPAAPDYFSVCVAATCTYYSTVGNGLHSYVHGVCMCIVCRCLSVRACVRACVWYIYTYIAPPVQVAEGEPPCVQVDYLR